VFIHAKRSEESLIFKKQELIKISRNSKINLSSNKIQTEKSVYLFLNKRPHKAAPIPDPQRLPFKDSLLLQNLVGPGYLELPFSPPVSRK